jgi:surfeit locus 1 family protein
VRCRLRGKSPREHDNFRLSQEISPSVSPEPMARALMRIADHRFAPTLFATALTLVAVALFARLGVWQLDRAGEKEKLQTQYARGQASVVELTASNAKSLSRYQRVTARGRYDSARQILLDNMPSAMGQPGYRVVTPFELDSGGVILVDRGWLPMGPSRAQIPDIEVGTESRTISGRLDLLPRPGVRLGPAAGAEAKNWPRVMSFPEQATIERALGRELLPGLILLDADQPDGYERVWQARADFGPERHIGYAVQWFAFALVAVVIYVLLGFKRGKELDERSR